MRKTTFAVLLATVGAAALSQGCYVSTGGGYYSGSRYDQPRYTQQPSYQPTQPGSYTPPPPPATQPPPHKPGVQPGARVPRVPSVPGTAAPGVFLPGIQEPPITQHPSQLFAAGLAAGMPPGYPAANTNGYWVWNDGPLWHLQTTTTGGVERFRGRITGLQGEIPSLRPSSSALASRFAKSPNGDWIFDYQSSVDGDGFTFTIGNNGCARIDLQAPRLTITVGRTSEHPQVGNFVVCPAQQQVIVPRVSRR